MKLASRLKVAVTLVSAGVYNMGTAATKCRTLTQVIADGASDASAIKVGDTGVQFTVEDASGNWEDGLYTITSSTQITRTSVLASSAGGTTAATFSGAMVAFNAASGSQMSKLLSSDDGQTIGQLNAVTAASLQGSTLLVADAGAVAMDTLYTYLVNRMTAAGLFSGSGTATPSDTTAPAVSSAQVANATPTVIAITMGENLVNSVPPASAFAVSGGKTVNAVSISGAVVSLTVSAAYAYGDTITVGYTAPSTNPRLQDAAGNPTASFAGRAVTNNISAPVVGGGSYDTLVARWRFDPLADTTPEVYAETNGTTNRWADEQGGVWSKRFVAGQDGSVQFKVKAFNDFRIHFTFNPGYRSSSQSYLAFGFPDVVHYGVINPDTPKGSGSATSGVSGATNDVVKVTRTGSTWICSVSKAGGAFVEVARWTNSWTGECYPVIQHIGGLQVTELQSSGLEAF
jgi:hypothetical protein